MTNCIQQILIHTTLPSKKKQWTWVQCNKKATILGYCKKHVIIKELKSD